MPLGIVTVDPNLGNSAATVAWMAVWLLFAGTCTAIVWFKGV